MERRSVSNRTDATVLVVDDEPYVRSALARTLRRSVARILLAGGADEAERLAGVHSVDLVLADHGLPGTTGLELLGRFQARGLRAHRLLITGHAEDSLDALALARAGVSRLISKPWDPEALRELVQAFLEGRSGAVDAAQAREEEPGSGSDVWLVQTRAALAAAAGEAAAIGAACRALSALVADGEASFFDERSERLRALPATVRGPSATQAPGLRAPLASCPLDALGDDEVEALAHARAASGPIVLRRASRRAVARTALLACVRADGRPLGVLQLVSDEALVERPELLARIAALATALGAALLRDGACRRRGAAA